MGQITGAITTTCTETSFGESETVTILIGAGGPTLIEYQSFLGVLPLISGIRVLLNRIGISLTRMGGLLRCLYEGVPSLLFSESRGGQTFDTATFGEDPLRFREGNEGCGASGAFEGQLAISPSQAVRLV
jgi:hypothetical protein